MSEEKSPLLKLRVYPTCEKFVRYSCISSLVTSILFIFTVFSCDNPWDFSTSGCTFLLSMLSLGFLVLAGLIYFSWWLFRCTCPFSHEEGVNVASMV